MSELRRAPGGFPVVGVIGGGQLARMLAPPAAALGIQLSVLAETPDASAALVVPSAPVGDHADVEAVCRFARSCDVVTFDHEHVPEPVLEALVAQGTLLHPTPDALRYAQDKLAMRRRLRAAGIPCPRWAQARDAGEVAAFGDAVGWPVMAKAPRGGYDGKGLRLAESAGDLADWLERCVQDAAAGSGPFAGGILLEELVAFERELAVLVARSPSGQAAAWPVVETVQTDGICTDVVAPAPGLHPAVAAEATCAGLRIAGELGVTGVLAVEMFQVAPVAPGGGGGSVASGGRDGPAHLAGFMAGFRGGFLVNELAMRPHNSGHWSIDGAVTSQFEQHLRAVLDLPLGDPRPVAPWTVMANVLGGPHEALYPAYRHVMARDPGAKVHMYGKGVRPGRKLGHVTVSGRDLADCRARARHAADYLQGEIDE